MAVVKGVNCGFVSSAPEADPTGDAGGMDDVALAVKDTSPATAVKVTEIGWWSDNISVAADYDVAIYDHNIGDNNPEAVVGSISADNPKGTSAGWKRVTGLNIEISPSTIYWLALQLDVHVASSNNNFTSDAGEKTDFKIGSQSALVDPWGVSPFTFARMVAVYAVWEAAAPPAAGNSQMMGANF